MNSGIIAAELGITDGQVRSVRSLLEDGATVPFIARYRKEATGSLDEVAIMSIRDRIAQLEELAKRREAILGSLAERELLTDELREKINSAGTRAALEDIYLPFRPKKRTRATIAREKGLEPLAAVLLAQSADPPVDPEEEARPYVDPEKGVSTVEEALSGARDIIAETVSEDQEARERIRRLFSSKSLVSSKVARGAEEAGAKYRDYFDWTEPCAALPSHRLLAMMRGEREKFLRLSFGPPEEEAVAILLDHFVTSDVPASNHVAAAVRDSYDRLLSLSMASELRSELKRRADGEAIAVFASNLRELLLAPPLGQKRVLAVDPGFRTGCKIAILGAQGELLHHDTIFPHSGERQADEAGRKIVSLCGRHGIEAVAIGNGTAGRETESFIRALSLPGAPMVVMVNESGASIYSASEAAREEFPDMDITVRGAVSIGRRLMDPLAELVKIDPKSIGVGQYQHDVDQPELKRSLDEVVMICVNGVGVNLNTASRQLLSYVSGLGPVLSANIVDHRAANGPFTDRGQLLGVPRLGRKAFEQAAGFLRLEGGDNPLDSSGVHPESYPIVDRMARDSGCSVKELMADAALRDSIPLERYAGEGAGLPTLRDIMAELARPGRDPREKFEAFSFSGEVEKLEDVRKGMALPGIVTNVTAFGAFVDIGVHQDGLVHISRLADRFVRDPADVVRVNQRVTVTVLDVDLERRRISLSMRREPG